ncbi:MAG: site-specific integrase, partial [Nitrospinae bacterium]|nr:site-specific integrase [Nitrospinota bacterium]
MAGQHSLQTHLHAGCNGASGPGSLDGLSPTFGVDIRSFRVSPAEEVRRRAELCGALERRIEELPPLAREPLLAYFHSLRRRNYALNTLRGYVGVLRGFALALPGVGKAGWASVSPPDVHRFIEAEQAQGRRASTINVKLKILHGFYAFLTD